MAKRRKKVDPFDVFANAYGFYATALVLGGRKERHVFTASLLVNDALALELLLKCAHVVRRRNPRKHGHDVRKLFAGLSKADKRAVQREYDSQVAGYPLTPKALERGHLLDIDSVLLRTNGIFGAMRYWHELPDWPQDANNRSSDVGTNLLLNALILFLRSLNPDWKSRFEKFAKHGHPHLNFKHFPLPT